MIRSEESNGNFNLQNSTVYEFQSIQLSTTFKHEHGKKVNTNTSCFSTKLQMNNPKRSFKKAAIKHYWKMFQGFWKIRKSQNWQTHFLSVFKSFTRIRYVHGHELSRKFSSSDKYGNATALNYMSLERSFQKTTSRDKLFVRTCDAVAKLW